MAKKKYFSEEERKEARRAIGRKCYHNNREKRLERQNEYYANNKNTYQDYYTRNKEKIIEYQIEYQKEYDKTPMARASSLLSAYKKNDKIANRGKGDLTAKWIVENIFTKPCIYCGETDWRKLGCDRIDNDLTHTKDNVVTCCGKCNVKRGKKTFEEFLKEMQEKMLEEFETP